MKKEPEIIGVYDMYALRRHNKKYALLTESQRERVDQLVERSMGSY